MLCVDRYVALTMSDVYACHAYKDAMSEMMPYVDIVFGNRHEAKAYAAANELTVSDVGDVARHIARLPKANGRRGRLVVITRGSQSTVVIEDGVERRSDSTSLHTNPWDVSPEITPRENLKIGANRTPDPNRPTRRVCFLETGTNQNS